MGERVAANVIESRSRSLASRWGSLKKHHGIHLAQGGYTINIIPENWPLITVQRIFARYKTECVLDYDRIEYRSFTLDQGGQWMIESEFKNTPDAITAAQNMLSAAQALVSPGKGRRL